MNAETHPCDYAYPIAPGDVPYWQPGMTLRDYFAGQALAGLCADPQATDNMSAKEIAQYCYGTADGLLAERAKAEGRSND